MIPPLNQMSDRDRHNFTFQLERIVDGSCDLSVVTIGCGVGFHVAFLGLSTMNWFFTAGCLIAMLSALYVHVIASIELIRRTRLRGAGLISDELNFDQTAAIEAVFPLSAVALFIPFSMNCFTTVGWIAVVVALCVHTFLVVLVISTGRAVEEQAWYLAIDEERRTQLPVDVYARRALRYPIGTCATKIALFFTRLSIRTPTGVVLAIQCIAALLAFLTVFLPKPALPFALVLPIVALLFTTSIASDRTTRHRLINNWTVCTFAVLIGIADAYRKDTLSFTCSATLLVVTIALWQAVVAGMILWSPSEWWTRRLSFVVESLLGSEFSETSEAQLFRRCLWFCMLGARHHQAAFTDTFFKWLHDVRLSRCADGDHEYVGAADISRLLTACAIEQIKDVCKLDEARTNVERLIRDLKDSFHHL